MASELTTLWVYLARRDSKGVRILALLTGRQQSAIRLTDTSLLALPAPWQIKLDRVVYDERMLWEPWIESAEDYEKLKISLKNRGYTGLPTNGKPQFSRADFLTFSEINVNKLPKQKIMLR